MQGKMNLKEENSKMGITGASVRVNRLKPAGRNLLCDQVMRLYKKDPVIFSEMDADLKM